MVQIDTLKRSMVCKLFQDHRGVELSGQWDRERSVDTCSATMTQTSTLPNPQPLLNRLLPALPVLIHRLALVNPHRRPHRPIRTNPLPLHPQRRSHLLPLLPRRPPPQSLLLVHAMRLPILAPLLHILHLLAPALGRLGADVRGMQFVDFDVPADEVERVG